MQDRVGQQFGNYRLVHQLGQGGFAEVYLAEHLHLAGRHVAIKLLYARGNSFQNFQSEAQTIANLRHPNIVEVLDFGIEPTMNTPYLVMSYASHGTLRSRYPKGTRLSLNEIVMLLTPMAQALFYAHQQGLVHRDVKPENMLISDNNTILLSDFGIAVTSQSVRSIHMESGGTPAYMAPEQMQGKARAASDQYALGIIAYEWLCGSTPFHGPSPLNFMVQHTTEQPPSLCERVPGLSRQSEAIVMRALSKDHHQRFSNVVEFTDALAATASGTMTVRKQPPTAGPTITAPMANSRLLMTGPIAGGTSSVAPSNLVKKPSGTFTPPPNYSRAPETLSASPLSQNTTAPYTGSSWSVPNYSRAPETLSASIPAQNTTAPFTGPSWPEQQYATPHAPYHEPNYNHPVRQSSPRPPSGGTITLLVTLVMLVVLALLTGIGVVVWNSASAHIGLTPPATSTITSTQLLTTPTPNPNGSLDISVSPATLVAQAGSTTCADWTNSFYGADAHWDCTILLQNTGNTMVNWQASAPQDKMVTFTTGATGFLNAGEQWPLHAYIPPSSCSSGASFNITITVVQSGITHTVAVQCG